MPRFGVLGSGEVGQALARGLKQHGHDVRIGSRTPAKLAGFAKEQKITAATFAEVAQWAEALVLAVAGTGAEEAVDDAGPTNLAGKLVIDTTNPIAKDPPHDGVLRYITGPNESLMERLQARVPTAKFVKCFNSVGSAQMVNPKVRGGPPTMFYCGNDEGAKATVKQILEQFGWEPCDMGRAASARAIEPLAQLWCIPGFLSNSWTHAFKLLKA